MITIRLFRPSDLLPCTQVFIQVFKEPPWHDQWPSISKAQAYVRELTQMPRFRGYVVWEVDEQTGSERIVACVN